MAAYAWVVYSQHVLNVGLFFLYVRKKENFEIVKVEIIELEKSKFENLVYMFLEGGLSGISLN